MSIRSDSASMVGRARPFAVRRAAGLALACALALWPLSRAAGQATTQPSSTRLYTITGVKVDVTAESAVAAREQAMAQAFAQALSVLEARLVPSTMLTRVPKPDPNALLRDFEVAEEKVGATRYIGTLTVRFDPAKVRQFLWSAAIPFSDTMSEPVLVLPVFEPGGQPILFESSTPWLAAWAALPRERRVVPFVVPSGDFDDLKAISAAQALAADPTALGAIAARYQVQQVLIADVAPGGGHAGKAGKDKADKDGKPGKDDKAGDAAPGAAGGLSIRLLRVARDGSGQDSFDLPGQPGEDEAALLARAVQAVVTRVQDAWKLGTPQGIERTLLATMPIASLSDWIGLRRRVEAVRPVRQVELKGLSPTQANVVLHYAGDVEALVAALAEEGLTLRPAAPGTQGWLLRPRQPGDEAYPAAQAAPPPLGGLDGVGAPDGPAALETEMPGAFPTAPTLPAAARGSPAP